MATSGSHTDIFNYFEEKKSKHLFYSVIIDIIGMASMAIPFVGGVLDVMWAPLSGIAIFIMYKKTSLKARAGIGGFIGFTEELLPFTDIVPTATLMWAYTYHVDRDKTIARIAKRRFKDYEIIDKIQNRQYQPSFWQKIKSVFSSNRPSIYDDFPPLENDDPITINRDTINTSD